MFTKIALFRKVLYKCEEAKLLHGLKSLSPAPSSLEETLACLEIASALRTDQSN
jgi:hypothetical protein